MDFREPNHEEKGITEMWNTESYNIENEKRKTVVLNTSFIWEIICQ